MPIKTIPFNVLAKYENNRPRNFRFDVNALADFEQLTGMGFGQLMSMKAMFATCRALLYAGLKHEDRSLSVTKVGELIQEFITDEAVENPEIDFLMEKALEAAVEQGALGRMVKQNKAERAAKEAEAKSGNAPAVLVSVGQNPATDGSVVG